MTTLSGLRSQIRAKYPFVVVVDDVPHGFAKRREAAAFATSAMFDLNVTRVETTQLRLTKDGRRFI